MSRHAAATPSTPACATSAHAACRQRAPPTSCRLSRCRRHATSRRVTPCHASMSPMLAAPPSRRRPAPAACHVAVDATMRRLQPRCRCPPSTHDRRPPRRYDATPPYAAPRAHATARPPHAVVERRVYTARWRYAATRTRGVAGQR
ncbi:hypothetical protein TNCT_292241 [Trichonephila clavata]|uniref:Uncharacterized protein n=1 Tax=Trichonephila clavata TaxID=2740835 RepID=A0A8X6L070_TRICU|nr:hypothetical protein TNCT_292241 [Trichonephila clavata]